jgi:hypothetical protein
MQLILEIIKPEVGGANVFAIAIKQLCVSKQQLNAVTPPMTQQL